MSDPRKPIFDAVRAARHGAAFQHMEVGALNNLLDAFNVPRAGQAAKPAPAVAGGRATSEAGIALIHSFEGLAVLRTDGKVEAYPDPGTGGAPWTIGWGSTGMDPFNGGRIRKGTIWTRDQCNERFKQHLAQFEKTVRDGLGGKPANQAQFDAMVSLCYNIGPAAFGGSTLLRLHNAGDFDGAAKQFRRWNRAGGRVMNGLTRRREAEEKMYRGGA
jgi:lysozyme